MVQWKERDVGMGGFLLVCVWATHIVALGSVIPCAKKGPRRSPTSYNLLEAVYHLPCTSIKSVNISFLQKTKWHISILINTIKN